MQICVQERLGDGVADVAAPDHVTMPFCLVSARCEAEYPRLVRVPRGLWRLLDLSACICLLKVVVMECR